MKSDRAKIKDLMPKLWQCLKDGNYRDTRHVLDRKRQRNLTREEVLRVLQNGHHEKRKDKYDEQYHAWNYAVRGKTIDRRDLRVIVSFDENDLLIITAIEL